jgi:hypothetical protein
LEESTVSAYKYTMIFTYFSGITATNSVPVRLGGWSESYYSNIKTSTTDASWLVLMQARLAMCPRGTVINKWRVQQVDPAGVSQLNRVSLAAPTTFLSDVPQMALKIPFFMAGGASQVIREFRGLPDAVVSVGEYAPTPAYTTAVQGFLNSLIDAAWQARQRVKTNPQYQINSIAAGGVVTMIDAFPGIANGTRVQILRTVNPQTGRKFGYFATVEATVDNSHFTIAGPKVVVSGFGTMRLAAVGYPGFNAPQLQAAEAVVRKVGRPSRSYSGRASRHQ